MKKYEILEHKADLKIRALGKTKRELFLNMLKGMTESQKAKKLKTEVKRQIKIKSPDLPALLVDFLSEALCLSQINKEVYFNVSFQKFTDNEIIGKLIGQKVERFNEDIKAATYHDLDIRQKKENWEATVLFDI